eukprot:SAG11_NODE_1935_length_4036_cov_2.347219_3_plen_199_part_00
MWCLIQSLGSLLPGLTAYVERSRTEIGEGQTLPIAQGFAGEVALSILRDQVEGFVLTHAHLDHSGPQRPRVFLFYPHYSMICVVNVRLYMPPASIDQEIQARVCVCLYDTLCEQLAWRWSHPSSWEAQNASLRCRRRWPRCARTSLITHSGQIWQVRCASPQTHTRSIPATPRVVMVSQMLSRLDRRAPVPNVQLNVV